MKNFLAAKKLWFQRKQFYVSMKKYTPRFLSLVLSQSQDFKSQSQDFNIFTNLNRSFFPHVTLTRVVIFVWKTQNFVINMFLTIRREKFGIL